MLLMIAGSGSGAGDSGSIRLVGQAVSSNNSSGVERIEFADGSYWSKSTLVAEADRPVISAAAVIAEPEAEFELMLSAMTPATVVDPLWV